MGKLLLKTIFILFFATTHSFASSHLPDACLTSFKRAALEAHNIYRNHHHVPPLGLDNTDNQAQKYAQHLADKNNGLKHSSNRDGKGENLFAKFTTKALSQDFCAGIRIIFIIKQIPKI